MGALVLTAVPKLTPVRIGVFYPQRKMKTEKIIKLRINKFEIETDEWSVKNNFFWLRHGNSDTASFTIHFDEIDDLKEIIKRFENSEENKK